MKSILLTCITLFLYSLSFGNNQTQVNFFAADNPNIQYTGRIDFTDKKLPRFWQPGVFITAKFTGSYCAIILNDEMLWGKNHNYVEIVVDGVANRLQTKAPTDTIVVAENLSNGVHTLIICKNTEANIGYLAFAGLLCEDLIKPDEKPIRKIEFFGNSITCGTGADTREIACGKGEWHDQHNAWLSYGPITSRTLNAQFHLSSVSGIGLMHSCCGMNILMPQVYDKVSMRNDTIAWDFKLYQPDVVTICLGQNDGVQDNALFIENYVSFLNVLRTHYPKASFICLTSPMADVNLKTFMVQELSQVVKLMNRKGDKKVYMYSFSKQYKNGCDSHPDLAEHELIANELTAYIKKVMRW
jgi:lysophospholipase L1-like esterase